MRWTLAGLVVAGALIGASRPGSADDPAVTIYVGPQTRDGFVDIDQGIVDSIRDIKNELRHSRLFRVVETADGSTITLTVVGW